MENSGLTLHYLQTLSSDELISLADEHGLDIPPDLERIFIIEELLDFAGDADARKEINNDAILSELDDITELPLLYNDSFIDALIRDPLWVFVFWEINEHDRQVLEYLDDFRCFCLRITPINEKTLKPISATPQAAGSSFVIEIGKEDNSWYLGIPTEPLAVSKDPAENNSRCYRIELCAMHNDDLTIIAVTRPLLLPQPIEPALGKNEKTGNQAVYRNPLSSLSGADQFILTRSIDRRPRELG